ncbi:hypothetical protein SLEP1_g22726 [Rubroshorea leprosula]|uniref:Cytochrome P450 n=1 Tax=Rubroshorea leprosula TaxID=152421 RepID=A0AAV5JJG8_9ROSI|nr:hypothetical protein SLEP1_g22726 [Rubroshorea leprosula]
MAIHRDKNLWDDPLSFKPNRFENGDQGEGYKMMPFGLGRRACPGAGLGLRIVGLTLGSLLQCFEWKKLKDEEIDVLEGIGLTMPKARPIVGLCKARPIINKALLH